MHAHNAGLAQERRGRRLTEPTLDRGVAARRRSCPERQQSPALTATRGEDDPAAEADGVPEMRQHPLRPLGGKVQAKYVRRAPDRLGALGLVDVEVLSRALGAVVTATAEEARDTDALRDVLPVVPTDHLEVALGGHRVPDDEGALADQRHRRSP